MIVKSHLLSCIALLGLFSLHAQEFKALDYSKFNKSDLTTNLFIGNTSPLSSLRKPGDTYNMYGFIQAYKEFSNNDNAGNFKQLKNIQRFNKAITYSNTINIGLIHVEYEVPDNSSLQNNGVSIDENGVVTRLTDDYIFTKLESTIIAPLALRKRGATTTFILNRDFLVNNTNNSIVSVKADFDSGNGPQTIDFNTPITIEYQSSGKKALTFTIELSNGETITRHSSLIVNTDRRRASNEVTSSLIADVSVYDNATSHEGLAEYEIFVSPDNVFDKPIIIPDGFDPLDTRSIAGIYELLEYENNGTTENLGDYIRNNEGYDVVIVNFPAYFRLSDGSLQSMANLTDVNGDDTISTADYPGSTLIDGGSDFIERNAYNLVEILNVLNAQKVGDEENVIIGPSMGGLISRYALGYMEQQNLDHETRLWMSLDSPHLGANVPIGMQHLFNYLGYGLDTWVGDFSIEAVRPIVDGMLKSAAARQMLTDHFEPHLESGEIADFDSSKTLPEVHPFNITFFNRINGLTTSGYPETTRNVSFINGSGAVAPYQDINGNDITPGVKVIDAFLENVATLTDAHFDTWFTPNSNQTIKIDDIWIDAPWLCFCDINAEPNAKAPSYTNGIDAAPGGLFDLGALKADFQGTDPTVDAFFNSLNTDYFNFIPAVSSMAIEGSNLDWYTNLDSLLGQGDTPWDGVTTTNPNTPFVNWYMPPTNEPHVEITAANVAFALDEIVKKADLSPKMILQGAMLNPASGENNLMRDDLRTNNVIPTTSPYSDALTCAPAVFNTTGANAIVDWVWVELRDANDSSIIEASRSALLQRDGDVVDVDGTSSLAFEIPGRPYYIAVNHRNHLGVMSEAPIALSRLPKIVDFTNNTVTMYGTNATTTAGMPSGVQALWAGDVNGNNSIRYLGFGNDTNMIKSSILNHPDNTNNSSIFQFTGYNNADFNMDGRVRYLGFGNDTNRLKSSILTHPENTTGSTIFTFSQQIPN